MKGYIVQKGAPILATIPEPVLTKQHIIVKNLCAGINFHDITALQNPTFENNQKKLGFEGIGIIEQISESCVRKFEIGQRVCYSTAFGVGAFAEKVLIHENLVNEVPNYTTNEQAATIFKGLASHMLLFRTYNLKKGDTLGITSASGGVASYLTQWASSFGINVVGLCSNQQNTNIALENGCKAVFQYGAANNFIAKVKSLSETGLGCNVFYDSIGIKGYAVGIKSLAPFGLYVNYGDITGEIKGMSAKHFESKALFFTTPSTFYSKANITELNLTTNMIFENIHNHTLRPNIKKYKFSSLGKAFTDMRAGIAPGHKVLVINE